MSKKVKIPALKVNQWLPSWNDVQWGKDNLKRRPEEPFLFLFSISAKKLKRLSGVYKRNTEERNFASEDFGIQRRHDPERSKIIQEYVVNGYPWSELSSSKRTSGKFDDLKKPGWLPTAIVLNILTGEDRRKGKSVDSDDLITVGELGNAFVELSFPNSFNEDDYKFKELPPIEIIDGQHRLWAFDDDVIDDDYELPVVAFHGLGLSWQAYLFYTINISPKKINRSLAFDLYPLLRNEEWLERFDGHNIYRETRAQEIVDLLNAHPESPWHDWINMLGEGEGVIKKVSQSAWIRSLTATFVKSYDAGGNKMGGLFGAPVGQDKTMLPWGKEEQAAIIILFGMKFRDFLRKSDIEWAQNLRAELNSSSAAEQQKVFDQRNLDAAFYSKDSLINQDQGIRVLLHILNDFLYLNSDNLELQKFYLEYSEGDSISIINDAIEKLTDFKIGEFLNELAKELIRYDWRSFNSSSIENSAIKSKKAGFRGSGGYKVLRFDVLEFLSHSQNNTISESADHLKTLN